MDNDNIVEIEKFILQEYDVCIRVHTSPFTWQVVTRKKYFKKRGWRFHEAHIRDYKTRQLYYTIVDKNFNEIAYSWCTDKHELKEIIETCQSLYVVSL